MQIRLTLNSFGVNAQQLLNPVIAMTDTRSTASAEQYCYAIATENLLQLQAIRDLDVGILHHAQDSISIMVACEWSVSLTIDDTAAMREREND